MSFVYFVLVALCAFNLVKINAEDGAFPAEVKTCKKDSSDYSSCLRLAIQESWPVFIRGIPELDIPAFDPFFVEYQAGDFQMSDVSVHAVIRNVKAYGLKDARFLSVKANHSNGRFSLEIDVEKNKTLIEGDYKAEGMVGPIRIGGKGQFNISMEDIRAVWEIDGPVVNDKWIIESVTVTPDIGKMKVWASDLFYGNQLLTKAALALINEYWPVLRRMVPPSVSDVWNTYLRDLVGHIFSKVSFSKTFP